MRNVMTAAAGLMALVLAAGAAEAANCGTSAKGFDGFIKEFRKEAAAAGVSKRGLSLLDGVEFQPAIIKKDRSQSVFSTAFLDFQAKMVTGNRIKTGRALVAKHKKSLRAVADRTYEDLPP